MDSLLAQDHEPLEIVVYDGGSTDGTLEILRSYPVELHVEPGLGQMAAINKGWKRTTAEFVTWWAGDDRYKPGAIRRLATELEAHPQAAVAHGDANMIDEQGEIIRRVRPGNIQLIDLFKRFGLVPQSALIRRSALTLSGMMDEKKKLAADWDLFLRIAQYFEMRYVPFLASECRLHSGSEDARNRDRLGPASIAVIDEFFERPDLTQEQRRGHKYAIAGSRLIAAYYYFAGGNRDLGVQMLCTAMKVAPSVFFTTPAGPRLLAQLLIPKPAIELSKRTLQALRRRGASRSRSQ